MERKGGGTVNVSPCQTPRSAGIRDLRTGEGSFSGKHDKEKGVNIQVVVRCRPMSDDEVRMNTPVVITCNDKRREVCAVQSIANKQIDKTFIFDKVFGPTSQQKDLFDQAICPIVLEVLEGFNCTIFAYGQTGTGKTYTMEGGARKKNGEFPKDAGVIPRSVKQIFDILETQNVEYNVKVSFLELYNEEITDLLAPEELTRFIEDKSKKPLALMEDGKGGVLIRGLEEEIVTTAKEIYNILEKGSAKRRTAETLLNKQSSRSHSIFSITIHMKEYTPEGEEIIKSGKLNLVDLAGSENVTRSGAREGRAREAGEINKSLLTLGRVINTLVEHSGHIPYRDSKLTRLLRDSLGGKTKTCIIATLSPSIHSLEETLSTLDYAHRAKNIKNKPEVNQKMMKSALMKDLYLEIDRLKQEVHAAREKNGIYIPKDRYLQDEAEKKAMSEKIERMELDFESRDKKLGEIQELYNSQQKLTVELTDKLNMTEEKLKETAHSLCDLEERHRQAYATIREKEYLISNLIKSEKSLVERAHELRVELEKASHDVDSLFTKIERKTKIEDDNKDLLQKFQCKLTQQLQYLHKTVECSSTQLEQKLKGVEEDMRSFVSTKSDATNELCSRLEKMKVMYGTGIKGLHDLAGELDGNCGSTFDQLKSQFYKNFSSLEELFKGITSEADALLHDLQVNLHSQENNIITFAQQQHEAHSKAVEITRSVSQITDDFFMFLDVHASKLGQIVEEAQTVNDQKLTELEKNFEECAVHEERELLEKVAQMLAGSNAHKMKLIRSTVDEIRKSAATRTSKLQHEMSVMQENTRSVKAEWTNYTEGAESRYQEDTASLERGRNDMQNILHKCLEQVKSGSQQWTSAQESLICMEKNNLASVDHILREGMDIIEDTRGRFSSTASSAMEDTDTCSNNLLSTIEHSYKLDKEACQNLDSKIAPCCGDLRKLNSGHQLKIAEIAEDAGKCIQEEYMVDQPSSSTPRKRIITVPTIACIEKLRTPSFEELIESFRDAKLSKHSNGDVKHIVETINSWETLKLHSLPSTEQGQDLLH